MSYKNFRLVPIHPTESEILTDRSFNLRKNIIKGKFRNVEQYLRRHFHLLREDFLSTLRDGINSYRLKEPTTNIDVYKEVKVICFVDRFGTEKYKIQHKSINLKEDSKQFMRGSLLIFTRDEFCSVKFLAKVLYRRNNDEVAIKFVDEDLRVDTNCRYTMAECTAFFEPYYQVLRVLKKLAGDNFPMERYIIQVDASRSSNLPKYLNNSLVKVQNYVSLRASLSKLNPAQAKAYMAALTQEFVVIQGPPGTGKTYLGLKIAETLIKNAAVWHRNSPMLIVSHKNHALDQFLEGLIPVTERLIRVGGQSKSTELEPFNLAALKQNNKKDKNGLIDQFAAMNIDRDFDILKKALVVAMTTTAAARMKDTLEKLKCPIVIVEEAAEVLEAHVVASLTANCQHLILLGDHKQLKPGTADHVIGTRYHLGVSLFERMVNNGIQCYQLEVQHRMRPEISRLLKLRIYPFLKDHESVLKRASVGGVDKNLFFIDHDYPEEDSNLTSKKNSYEAHFLVVLAYYLVLNCHKDIAILTTYQGQAEELEKMVEGEDSLSSEKVRVSTLDAFQGQEAEIVLLSLVRSKMIGFLAAENRICVALSRARSGLYVMGNMDLLANNSRDWSLVKNNLAQNKAIGKELVLRCQNHGKRSRIRAVSDFKKVFPGGGCSKKCDFVLSCGHPCRYNCHYFDKNHGTYKCKEICERLICTSHKNVCKKLCYEKCQRCSVKCLKLFKKCGHKVLTKCSTSHCPHKSHVSN